jgi:hypothetical protein
MCISTRLVIAGVAHGWRDADHVLQQAMRVLDKAAWLIDARAMHPYDDFSAAC